MNFLHKLSAVRHNYRRQMPQYWLDALVDRVMRSQPPGVGVTIRGTVLAVLRNEWADMELIVPGINIVTDDGDAYYAQAAMGETPDDDFPAGGLRLGDDNTSPTKSDTDVTNFLAGTGHAITATYPKTNDGDSDNSGAGVDIASWLFSYTTGEGNAADIIEGAIVDNTTTPTAALTHFLFGAAFTKTSSDTLKVFVNHTFTGA